MSPNFADHHPIVSDRNRSFQNATARKRTYQNVEFWQNVPISYDLSIVVIVTDRALVCKPHYRIILVFISTNLLKVAKLPYFSLAAFGQL